MTTKTALVPRCDGDCQWAHLTDHDVMLAMMDDAMVLVAIIQGIALSDSCTNTDEHLALCDLEPFIEAHNWPDPLSAHYLAQNLERIYSAIQREGDLRKATRGMNR